MGGRRLHACRGPAAAIVVEPPPDNPPPRLQVEATKFTEVGFHGRDVDSIIRDLVDNAIIMIKQASSTSVHDGRPAPTSAACVGRGTGCKAGRGML